MDPSENEGAMGNSGRDGVQWGGFKVRVLGAKNLLGKKFQNCVRGKQ